MVHVQTFKSLEEMQEALQRNREAAMAGLAPAQNDLTYGSCWARFEDDLVIFGKVPTLIEVGLAEQKAGADADEVAFSIENVQHDLEENGLMFCDAYSVITPEGEVGHTHKVSAWPISESVFEDARRAEWDPMQMSVSGRVALTEAFTAIRTHRAKVMAKQLFGEEV